MTGTANTESGGPVTLSLLGVTRKTDNYGVRVLLSSAIDLLSSVHPGAEIILLDYGRESQSWREQTPAGERTVRLVNLRFSWRFFLPNNIFRLLFIVLLSRALPEAIRHRLWSKNPWLREVLSASAHFSLAGGDSFSDIYGLRRFLYVSLPQLLVLLMHRPLVLLPQTYGPFGSLPSRFVARWILRRACRVFSRDEEGVEIIRKLVGTRGPSVTFVPDLGFCMEPGSLDASIREELGALHKSGSLVGLNISSLLWMGGYTGDNMFGLKESYPALTRSLVEYLVKELGVRVLFVPHVCGGAHSQEDETRICRSLLAEMEPRFGERIVYLDYALDHRQMKSMIGQCDIFIGSRMHACIAAVSQGVPAACLAYSAKFEGAMRPVQAGVRVADLRRAGISDVKELCGDVFRNREKLRSELARTIPAIRDAVRGQVADLPFAWS